MALEDMIESCIEAGVTRFELYVDPTRRDVGPIGWSWEIDRGDPVKWVRIRKPWSMDFTWLGFRPNPNRLFGVLPFCVDFWDPWRVGVYVGSERNGYQGVSHETFEAGLRDALGKYLCESEGSSCPYEICEHHEGCLDGEND